jgi:acetolactate synthase-1/2/3 large subunit
MGLGLPHTIGACIASGGKRTVCVNGDGGIQLNIQEFATLKNLNLPIKIFVLNNHGYGSIRATQRNYFDGFYVASGETSGVILPDILKVAEGYGLHGVKIENHVHVKEKVREVLEYPGPVICEVLTSLEQPTQPRLVSRKQADGALVTCPMEDMWPFLAEEELKELMEYKD